jgi:PAS domain S-box-containing protein
MLGYSADELRTLSFIDITHPDDVAQNTQFFLQTLAGEIDNYRMNKRFLRKDGQYMWARLSVALRKSADGKPWHMISVIEDICNQKQSEVDLSFRQATIEQEAMSQTALLRDQGDAMRLCFKRVLDSAQSQRETEQRLTAITNSIPAMIGYWNGELRCEFANNAYRATAFRRCSVSEK